MAVRGSAPESYRPTSAESTAERRQRDCENRYGLVALVNQLALMLAYHYLLCEVGVPNGPRDVCTWPRRSSGGNSTVQALYVITGNPTKAPGTSRKVPGPVSKTRLAPPTTASRTRTGFKLSRSQMAAVSLARDRGCEELHCSLCRGGEAEGHEEKAKQGG